MALQDIDDLSEKEQGASGHVDQHKKIVRGLKSLKEQSVIAVVTGNSDEPEIQLYVNGVSI